jgi:hypothetical protein
MLIVRRRAWELMQIDKNFPMAHSRYVTPTPVWTLPLATGVIGPRPRQVEKPSLTRLEMVRRF